MIEKYVTPTVDLLPIGDILTASPGKDENWGEDELPGAGEDWD